MKNERDHFHRGVQSEDEVLCARGVSRRIVVVPADDNQIYEKVIYIVRDDAASRGVTAQEVLREAQSLLLPENIEIGEPMDSIVEDHDTERVSRILFALSGVALALSGGVLVYWFFAI